MNVRALPPLRSQILIFISRQLTKRTCKYQNFLENVPEVPESTLKYLQVPTALDTLSFRLFSTHLQFFVNFI